MIKVDKFIKGIQNSFVIDIAIEWNISNMFNCTRNDINSRGI